MEEIVDKALDVLRALRRFRWAALLIAWFVGVIGWAVVSQLPEVYTASARVSVDSNRILEPLLQGIVVQPDVDQRVALMSQTLMNRPNLEKLMRMADLDTEVMNERERELTIDELGRTVRLAGTRGNNSLYTVSYSHENPEIARRVVQSLMTIFIDSTLGNEREDSENAQRFLDRQILDYEGRLLAAEQRLSTFKRENAGKMPGEAGGYYQRRENITGIERATRLELREAKRRVDTLRRQLRDEPPTLPEGGGVAGLSALDAQLRAQSDELAGLLVRYTDRHPRVAQLRESIAALGARKAANALEERESEPVPSYSLVPNPVYQELRSLLVEAEARVSELEVRAAEYTDQVAELEATIDSIPKVEAELQELDRDYSVVKSQHETLLGRREAARLSEQVEQSKDDFKFRIVDPPFVPSTSETRKKLLSAGVLLAAIGIGGAVAYALSMLRPVFYTAEQTAARTGRPMIGAVSWQRRGSSLPVLLEHIAWFGLAVLLVAVCAVVLAIHADLLGRAQIEPLLESRIGPFLESVSRSFMRTVQLMVERVRERLGGGA